MALDIITIGVITGSILVWGGLIVFVIGLRRERKAKVNYVPKKRVKNKK